MTLGKLIANTRQLYVGALHEFGYEYPMLDAEGTNGVAEISEVTQAMLDNPDIAACLSAGVLRFEPVGQSDQHNNVQETVTDNLELPKYTDGDPAPESSQEISNEENSDRSSENGTTELGSGEATEHEQPQESETEIESNTNENEQADLSEEQTKLFEEINALTTKSAKDRIEELTDILVLSALAANGKTQGIQKSARERLQELIG